MISHLALGVILVRLSIAEKFVHNLSCGIPKALHQQPFSYQLLLLEL